jgi:cytosine deaminase
MDPWYSLGSGDMLEVAHMGLHVAQMTSQQGMRECFSAVTTRPYRGHPPEGEPAEGLNVGTY